MAAKWSSGYSRGISGNIGPTRLPVDILNRLDFAVKFEDFLDQYGYLSSTDDPWVEDDIGTPTAATVALDDDASLGSGGILLINAGTADSTGIQTQYTGATGLGEYVKPTSNKVFAFGCRFTTAGTGAVSLSALMAGLAVTDATAISTAGSNAVADCIAFYSSTTSANLTLEARRSSGSGTGSVTMGTLVHGTYNEVCFVVEPTTITSDTANGLITGYSRNANSGLWTRKGAIYAAIPNTEICPTFAAVNGIATDSDVYLDYYWVACER